MDWLNAYDLQDSEIRDIRDNYKDVPLQTLVNKQKSNYEQLADAARTRFEKKRCPIWSKSSRHRPSSPVLRKA